MKYSFLCVRPSRCMHKVSTPGDRELVRSEVTKVMTRLEMLMPLNWNTTVVHIFVHHTIDIIEKVGPFHVANMLDVERFHTLFKGLARGTKDVMASIANHYLLLEVSLATRLSEDMCWSIKPRESTPAGFFTRADSKNKADRVVEAIGNATEITFSTSDFKMIRTLWADSYPEYKELHNKFRKSKYYHQKGSDISTWLPQRQRTLLSPQEKQWQQMKPIAKSYKRVRFGGNVFVTESAQQGGKHNDSIIRQDYMCIHRKRKELVKGYGAILRLFEHEAYPGGPSRFVVEARWYENVQVCSVAKTQLVRDNPRHFLQTSAKYAFMSDCCTRPVALWPYDPLGRLPASDERRNWFDVIDRNQDEIIE